MTARVIAARRTAVAPRGGALARFEPHELGAAVLSAALEDAGLRPGDVDEVILGNAIGEGGNIARLTALAAGLPERVAGLTIDRQCCGGLDALLLARALVESGQADVVLAGGAESYSRQPRRIRQTHGGMQEPYEQARFTPWPDRDPEMATAADALARELGISRERQDRWAEASHARALANREVTRSELAGVPGADLAGDSFARTLGPALTARAPVLSGSVTRANTAVAADAAAICVVVSEARARAMSLTGVTILGGATLGGRPEMPGLAPVAAARAALRQAGVAVGDVAVAEIMEAYAVQAIACVEGIGIAPDRVNISGGALARGHPIGASGAILAVRLFHEMRRSPGLGLAAIAAAGGIGTALVLGPA